MTQPRQSNAGRGRVLVELERTCSACPEQYEGRTADGRSIYVRHRHGQGRLSIGKDIDDAVTADWLPSIMGGESRCSQGRVLLAWHDRDWDGTLRPGALAHVLYLAGFDLAPDVAQTVATSPDADDFIQAAAELGIHLTPKDAA